MCFIFVFNNYPYKWSMDILGEIILFSIDDYNKLLFSLKIHYWPTIHQICWYASRI